MTRVAIIGGGACGLWCANALKRNKPSIDVVIFDRQPIVGKKIAMSGNSRGNLTNLNVSSAGYNHPDFVASIINNISAKSIVDLFEIRGIRVSSDEQGRVYPISESAQAVVDMFRCDNDLRGVRTINHQEVSDIKINGHKFIVGQDAFDYVVIATGTNAGLGPKVPVKTYPTINGQDEFLVTERFPSLAAIGVKDDIKMLLGLRVKADMALSIGDKTYQSAGELQIIDKALSGIAMFVLSSYYARAKVNGSVGQPQVSVDLMPQLNHMQLREYLSNYVDINDLKPQSLEGLLAPKLSAWIYKRYLEIYSKRNIDTLSNFIKKVTFLVDTAYIPNNYQVISGGIDISEVEPSSLMSKKYPNLFIGGEVLDVDGLCGGYNLHFAFASGAVIADSIIKKENI